MRNRLSLLVFEWPLLLCLRWGLKILWSACQKWLVASVLFCFYVGIHCSEAFKSIAKLGYSRSGVARDSSCGSRWDHLYCSLWKTLTNSCTDNQTALGWRPNLQLTYPSPFDSIYSRPKIPFSQKTKPTFWVGFAATTIFTIFLSEQGTKNAIRRAINLQSVCRCLRGFWICHFSNLFLTVSKPTGLVYKFLWSLQFRFCENVVKIAHAFPLYFPPSLNKLATSVWCWVN